MERLQSRRFQWFLGGFGLIGSICCLVYYGNWRELTLPPLQLLLIIMLAICAEMLIRAERMRRICRELGQEVSLWDAWWVNTVGDFFARITPASLGGQVSRLATLTRLRLRMSGSMTVVLVEGIINRVSLALLVSVAIVLLLSEGTGVSAKGIFYSLLLLLIMAISYGILFAGLKRAGKIVVDWRRFLMRFDLLVLTLVHHVIRLGFLPLIVAYLGADVSLLKVFIWSFILLEGLSLIPIPSGGGSVEIAFVAVLQPLLGAQIAVTSLIWWRVASHYAYIAGGGVAVFLGTFGFAGRARALPEKVLEEDPDLVLEERCDPLGG